MANGGLMALPNCKLVGNVGPTKVDHSLGMLNHHSFLLRNSATNSYSFDHHFCGASKHCIKHLLHRLKARLYYHSSQLRLVFR
jgi:hypothetical protein